METIENQNIEYKRLTKIRTGEKGFKELAITCVSFANGQGGVIYIGYDDKLRQPLPDQVINTGEINDAVTRLRSLTFGVSMVNSEILADDSGSQYFTITIFPSIRSVATTSDGRIYLRIADKCEPIRSEDIHRLCDEKGAYQWEVVNTVIDISDIPLDNIIRLTAYIRLSDRVGSHIKQMDDIEILEFYNLVDGSYLTHLGVLWLGTAKQRSRLSYPITVQYIVYDELENKVRKVEWSDYSKNPMEMLLDIEREAVELTYFYEFPDGLFRKQIRYYHEKVVRELLVNAFAHQSFVISRDIIIAVYPDRLVISNGGGLPMGVTKDNILFSQHRRNPHMINLMKALKLMEGEGSGYDLIYEFNAMEAKSEPIIESDYSSVTVIQSAEILDRDIVPLLDYVLTNYKLSSKAYTAFGIVARMKKVSSLELARILQLPDSDRLRNYVDRLLKDNIIIRKGNTKASYFIVNPALLNNVKSNTFTSLKTIEPHTLKALILEDIRLHPNSLIRDISGRIPDVELKEVRKIIYQLVGDRLQTSGPRSDRRYFLIDGK